jgi:hypothetical protein
MLLTDIRRSVKQQATIAAEHAVQQQSALYSLLLAAVAVGYAALLARAKPMAVSLPTSSKRVD